MSGVCETYTAIMLCIETWFYAETLYRTLPGHL
jgi:hypothetical protein